jgi:hypothetical protein
MVNHASEVTRLGEALLLVGRLHEAGTLADEALDLAHKHERGNEALALAETLAGERGMEPLFLPIAFLLLLAPDGAWARAGATSTATAAITPLSTTFRFGHPYGYAPCGSGRQRAGQNPPWLAAGLRQRGPGRGPPAEIPPKVEISYWRRDR